MVGGIRIYKGCRLAYMKLFYLILIMLVLLGCNHDIKFDRVGWQQQSDPAFPSQNRKYMLDDLLESYDLKGKRYSDITRLTL